MDEKMMKAGGAAKRAELIKAFGDLSISTTKTRELTKLVSLFSMGSWTSKMKSPIGK